VDAARRLSHTEQAPISHFPQLAFVCVHPRLNLLPSNKRIGATLLFIERSPVNLPMFAPDA
jgi:hypothetical protein